MEMMPAKHCCMSLLGQKLGSSLLITVALASASCATLSPAPFESVPFLARSQTQDKANVSVTAAVLSAEESESIFGVDLYKREIQPVWLKIENDDPEPVWFLPAGLDPEYFTPDEAAYRNHVNSRGLNAEIDIHFREHGMGLYVAPRGERSGFVFSTLDEGTKAFKVDLFGQDQELRTFTFFITVPGIRPDHTTVDFANLYSPDQIVDYDLAGLRQALEELPCCTTNKKGSAQGDPLNLVMIGTPQQGFLASIRAGWDETETVELASTVKTFKSFLFGGRYRYSPVSSLYVFDRRQDIALQKARDTIHERNHMRFWMTNMRIDGQPVWIGQISRDIGVRFTKKTITTHKIDPDVDEARGFLLQDLWYSQSLVKYGFVEGVGAASYEKHRANLTGDPYFTDGLRLVMWLSDEPQDMEAVEVLDWERPPQVNR